MYIHFLLQAEELFNQTTKEIIKAKVGFREIGHFHVISLVFNYRKFFYCLSGEFAPARNQDKNTNYVLKVLERGKTVAFFHYDFTNLNECWWTRCQIETAHNAFYNLRGKVTDLRMVKYVMLLFIQ